MVAEFSVPPLKRCPIRRAPKFPDAYFACDLCFVPPVEKHFANVVLLTETDIGIVIPREKPACYQNLDRSGSPWIEDRAV